MLRKQVLISFSKGKLNSGHKVIWPF